MKYFLVFWNIMFLLLLASCDGYPSKEELEVRNYLYLDRSSVLHIDMNCPNVSKKYGTTKIEPINVKEISTGKLDNICNKCFNETLYIGLKEFSRAKSLNSDRKVKTLLYLEPGYTCYFDLDLLNKVSSYKVLKVLMVNEDKKNYVPLNESFHLCDKGYKIAKFMPFRMGDIKLEIYEGKEVYNIPFSVIHEQWDDFYADFYNCYVTMFNREGKMVGIDVDQMNSYRKDGYKWYISGYEKHPHLIYNIMCLSSKTVREHSLESFITNIKNNEEYRKVVYNDLIKDGFVDFSNFSTFKIFINKII